MSISRLYSPPMTHDRYFAKNSVTRARGECLLSLCDVRGGRGLLLLSEPRKARIPLARIPVKKVFRG